MQVITNIVNRKIHLRRTVLLTAVLVLFGFAGLLSSASAETKHPFPVLETEVPRISPGVLKARLDKGEIILIVDVRSLKAFEIEHITGAISVPLQQVESRLKGFPRKHEIVFY
jgi:hypothetical protein